MNGFEERGLEPVGSGANGIYSGMVFRSQELYAFRLGGGFAGFGFMMTSIVSIVAGGIAKGHPEQRTP